MFIAKLFLEVAVLVALFLLIRRSALYFFPGLAKGASAETPAKRGVKTLIFLLLGAIASVSFFWLFYAATYLFHSWNSDSTLVISKLSLVPSSLIFGFYLSTHFNGLVYRQFFDDPVDVLPQSETKKAALAKLGFTTLTVIPAVFLLAFQFNTYLKVQGDTFYHKELGSGEKVFSKNEVKRVMPDKGESVKIYLASGEVISTRHLSGNMNSFLDHFMK